MRKLQLYIGSERVDLFKDESVSITQSIQNVKDIEKIFTSFTKTFSVPASKTNNKLFKHYYNFDIINGFDARLKVNARLEINNLPFQLGKIKLEGADLKNEEIYAYKITFFGNTVELKDLLGEDKLQDLPLSQFNDVYSALRIRQALQRQESSSNNLICPLITHTQRLFYDSDDHTSDTGNLRWTNNQGQMHGVGWNQLKYALRVNKIIEAIEDRYSKPAYPVNLRFDSSMILNSNVPRFDRLFMWLHRKSGDVENLLSTTLAENQIDSWQNDSELVFSITDNLFLNSGTLGSIANDLATFELQCRPPVGNTDDYSVRVEGNGTTVFESGNVSGEQEFDLRSIYDNNSSFVVYISSTTAIAFQQLQWFIEYYDDLGEETVVNFYTTSFNLSTQFQFIISQQIPDMKVIDFLTGIFKMFNLTAYVNEEISTSDTTYIKVESLDDFYSSGDGFKQVDISEYVDTTKKAVDVALPYRQISLGYKDTKSFLAERYTQLANKQWGQLSYSTNEAELAGKLYKIELPFGHLQYERLTNQDNGQLRDIQWGYSVNESQNAYKGEALLFYPVRQTTGGISFINDINADGTFNGKEQVNTTNLPSNSLSFNPATSKINIHFENEINEYTGTTEFTDTLFKQEYKDYLVDTFSTKRRLVKITAYLPISIFSTIKLNNIVVINRIKYRINSMTTDLLTGKSELELLNIV